MSESGPERPSADVIILCGGLGTRLQGALGGLPKPMAPVAGRPFLELLMAQGVYHGFRRFILCAGHGADAIKKYFLAPEFEAAERGVEILVSVETQPLGTAGALALCAPMRRSAETIVMNGDSYCDLDLPGLLERHRRSGAAATVAAAPAGERRDAGYLQIEDGMIASFDEKDALKATGLINAGVYVFGTEAFEAIPAGTAYSLERQLMPALIAKGVAAFETDAEVFDIGTPERLDAFRRHVTEPT